MAAKDHLNHKQMGWRRRKDPFECKDCGTSTHDMREYYMVHDSVWGDAGMNPYEGMLCIGCLEDRLGRRLTPADFTDAEVNTWRASERLQNRQGRRDG
jgi:ribosomal protein L34E